MVTSTAVKADNPEVMQARRQGLPVIPRAEMLAELMRLKYGVAVAGSHGKTTTTSMVAMILDKGGLDPTVVVGGRVGTLGSGAQLGKGEFMVAEADESDRSFLKLTPTVAVVTNIDREHLDTYKDLADVQEAFLNFVNKVPFYGAAVLCLDDPAVQDILPAGGAPRRDLRRLAAGRGDRPRRRARADGIDLHRVLGRRRRWARSSWPSPGTTTSSTRWPRSRWGSTWACPSPPSRKAWPSFTGVDRRFQLRGEAGGITVIDDYGHHPTEIRATLETLRGRAGTRRTVVLFQPHRYTRTQHLWDDFCRAFHLADLVVLVDIYPAGEEPIAGHQLGDPGRRDRPQGASAGRVRRGHARGGRAPAGGGPRGRRRPHPGRGQRVDRGRRAAPAARRGRSRGRRDGLSERRAQPDRRQRRLLVPPVVDHPLVESDDPPFLRPERRTRVRRQRGWTYRADLRPPALRGRSWSR